MGWQIGDVVKWLWYGGMPSYTGISSHNWYGYLMLTESRIHREFAIHPSAQLLKCALQHSSGTLHPQPTQSHYYQYTDHTKSSHNETTTTNHQSIHFNNHITEPNSIDVCLNTKDIPIHIHHCTNILWPHIHSRLHHRPPQSLTHPLHTPHLWYRIHHILHHLLTIISQYPLYTLPTHRMDHHTHLCPRHSRSQSHYHIHFTPMATIVSITWLPQVDCLLLYTIHRTRKNYTWTLSIKYTLSSTTPTRLPHQWHTPTPKRQGLSCLNIHIHLQAL